MALPSGVLERYWKIMCTRGFYLENPQTEWVQRRSKKAEQSRRHSNHWNLPWKSHISMIDGGNFEPALRNNDDISETLDGYKVVPYQLCCLVFGHCNIYIYIYIYIYIHMYINPGYWSFRLTSLTSTT